MNELCWRSEHPLDLAASVARFRRWGEDPVNAVDDDGTYRRVIRVGGELAPYAARQQPDGAVTVISPEPAAALADLQYRLAEPLPRAPLAELAATDPVVAALIDRYPGLRPPLTPEPFEALVASITAQQVNLRWAATTRGRIVTAAGAEVAFEGIALRAFPTPAAVAALGAQALRDMQLNWAKAHAIVGVAEAAAAGMLDGLADLGDDEVVARLTTLRGVGRWTAEWFLARCLGRPSAVAAGDLGVRKAVGARYLGLDRPASEAEVREVAPGWGDAANWVAHLLLAELP